jgi:hypothetical protein
MTLGTGLFKTTRGPQEQVAAQLVTNCLQVQLYVQ